MGIEYVTISAGGMNWSGFEQIEVSAAFNEAAREFSFTVFCELGKSATNAVFRVGAEVSIHANDDLLVTGYVDRKSPRIEAENAIITITGRSKSADLIDSSAKHETGNFQNKDPMEIGNAVSDGISARFETDQQLEKVEQYQVTPGESVFRLVEHLASEQGMTITGTPEGNAKITKAGSQRHSGGLIEGDGSPFGQQTTFLSASAEHNDKNRHSEYTVLGQRPFGHGADNLQIRALARDKGVDRHRPMIIVINEDTTKKLAKKRVKNRRDRAAGHALKADIDVQGFRDEAGVVWTPGWLVWVESATLDIAQDMLIEKVSYAQSASGSIASLSLTDPRAYDGKSGKGNKSGSEWEMDDSEATE